MNCIERSSACVAAESKVFEVLKSQGIEYTNYPHNPVLTCADKIDVEIPAPAVKNLFLKDNKGGFWLIAALEETQISLKNVAKILRVGSLRFADEKALTEHLGVKAGAVTIFGLINDAQKKVTPIIDASILQSEKTRFHPLHNEATTVIASKDLVKFVQCLGREFKILTPKELT